MKTDVKDIVRMCLHCANSKMRTLIPQKSEETVHGTKIGEVVLLDFLHLGETKRPAFF